MELAPQQIDEYRLQKIIEHIVMDRQGYVVACREHVARKGPGLGKAKACKKPPSTVELRHGF